jgi:short-subunit dehydrogenase
LYAGSSSGLGKECARVLAKRGAHVVLAARRVELLNEVKALITAETPTAQVEVMHLDLSELKSVRQFAEEFKQKNLPLNILMYVINLLFSSVLFLV